MSKVEDILYPRYTDIKQILLGHSADDPGDGHASRKEAAMPNGHASSAPEQQAPDSQHTAADLGTAAAPTAAAEEPSRKRARRDVSGPSNAEEAELLRKKLGISSAKPSSAVVPATFSFDFVVQRAEEAAGAAQPDQAAQEPHNATQSQEGAENEDPALAERLARVMGEPSGRSTKRRVFVGGMPFGYEEEDVRQYWGYCGEIESLDLMRFPDTGRFKGIAFITFATDEGYQAALACDGEWIDNTQVRVEVCKSAGAMPKRSARDNGDANSRGSHQDRRRSGTAAPKVAGYNVAYVGNIAFEAGESDLRELMSDCTITKVRLHTDKETGKFKGFAHIHFADEESLDKAMAYDGASVQGRSLKIGYAQEKKQHQQPAE